MAAMTVGELRSQWSKLTDLAQALSEQLDAEETSGAVATIDTETIKICSGFFVPSCMTGEPEPGIDDTITVEDLRRSMTDILSWLSDVGTVLEGVEDSRQLGISGAEETGATQD